MPELIWQKRNGNWRSNAFDPNSKRLCPTCEQGLAAGYARHPGCRDWHEAALQAERRRKTTEAKEQS